MLHVGCKSRSNYSYNHHAPNSSTTAAAEVPLDSADSALCSLPPWCARRAARPPREGSATGSSAVEMPRAKRRGRRAPAVETPRPENFQTMEPPKNI